MSNFNSADLKRPKHPHEPYSLEKHGTQKNNWIKESYFEIAQRQLKYEHVRRHNEIEVQNLRYLKFRWQWNSRAAVSSEDSHQRP